MSTLSEAELRSRITGRMESGLLPLAREVKLFAGYGHSEICDACGQEIPQQAVLYEIELIRQQERPMVLSMHRPCFDVWLECSQRGMSPSDGQACLQL